MRVIIRRPAAADIRHGRRWYEAQREGLGDEFFAVVREMILRVGDAPEVWPVVHRDVRRVLLRRFPYALFYTIRGDRVFVIACLSTSRAPRRWKSRAQ
jgi:hypothetical protein